MIKVHLVADGLEAVNDGFEEFMEAAEQNADPIPGIQKMREAWVTLGQGLFNASDEDIIQTMSFLVTLLSSKDRAS